MVTDSKPNTVLAALEVLFILNLLACTEAPKRKLPPVDPIPPGSCDFSAGWEAHAAGSVFSSDGNLLDGLPGDPSLVSTTTGFVMYYGAAIGDFTDQNTVRIFRATSTDGLAWQRNSTPVLSPVPGAWDSAKVETPNVLKRPDGSWAMFYSGSNKTDELGFQIGLATSTDGQTWDHAQNDPVLKTTEDELSLIGPSVIYDPSVGEYWMYYASIAKDGTIGIYRATSVDGRSWRDRNQVLELDVERTRTEDFGVMGPEVLKVGTHYEMIYNLLLAPNGTSGGIYHARSADGTSWSKTAVNLRAPTGGSAFDADEVGAQSWLPTPNGYRIYYVGTHTDRKTYFDVGFGILSHPCTAR